LLYQWGQISFGFDKRDERRILKNIVIFAKQGIDVRTYMHLPVSSIYKLIKIIDELNEPKQTIQENIVDDVPTTKTISNQFRNININI
jgi:hypothetical protein